MHGLQEGSGRGAVAGCTVLLGHAQAVSTAVGQEKGVVGGVFVGGQHPVPEKGIHTPSVEEQDLPGLEAGVAVSQFAERHFLPHPEEAKGVGIDAVHRQPGGFQGVVVKRVQPVALDGDPV